MGVSSKFTVLALVTLLGFFLFWEYLLPTSVTAQEQSEDIATLLEITIEDNQWVDPHTGIEFVLVKGGCFQMGDTFGEGKPEELPVHEVCVKDFLLAKFEITLGQWLEVMESDPGQFNKSDNYPVDQLSWDETQEFIKEFNKRSEMNFRLPTEAEWEYAARSGGKQERFAGGDNAEDVAWYGRLSGGTTHPVGSKEPNGLGLYDMSGNVWEWVQDWYDENYYQKSPRLNPTGPETGVYRVSRGGGGHASLSRIRTAYRGWVPPQSHFNYQGFRVALSPSDIPKRPKRQKKWGRTIVRPEDKR